MRKPQNLLRKTALGFAVTAALTVGLFLGLFAVVNLSPACLPPDLPTQC